ncbi:MAG TPA: serine/threonine-protein kinase, partial [Myxococcota bacterium]
MSEVFGRYELIERIARGGMAEILLARQLTGARRVCAVKRILPAFSHDVRFVSMFIDEARITIGLAHDNIVRLLDFGQVDGSYFMAMEYVDGTDLASLLRAHTAAGTPLPPIVAAAIIRDVCRGLAHAHALTDAQRHPLNIVHRDVSPHNILLSSSGRVKLTDFGIAAARNKLSLTTPGTVLGKAAYMAPEQAQGLGIDFRTDLWAVGVILWEALAGERLFVAETPVRTLERVIADPILAPSTRRANIPMALDALTMT